MSRVYIPVLPQPQATRTKAGIRAQIQQSGLLQQGGTATEKIAAENIDLVLNGQLRWGDTFSRKVARELESLSRSDYSGVPYYATRPSESTRDEGYYEVERVEINPAHPNTEQAFEAVVALSDAGTKEEHWRSVTTFSDETINTGLATGSGGLISIPSTARKVKWFDTASGTESASSTTTVTGEFGDLKVYDPTQPSFDDPTLIYEVPYADERGVDVRVWDDLGLSKTTTIGGNDFTRWVHAFHSAFEFDGRPVVDNGRMRLRFDEDAGVVELYEWDEYFHATVKALTDWSSDTNATLSTTTTNTYDGDAVRGDTDDPNTTGGRSITFDKSGTTDMSAADFITFWYYTDNAGGTHSLAITDGSAATDTVAFDAQVSADTGAFIEVDLSNYTNDLSTVDSLEFVFDGPSGEDKFVVVDSIRYGDLAYNQVTVDMGDYELVDADFEEMGPSDVRAYCEFYHTVDDRFEQALLSVQRGLDRAIARYPPGTTQTAELETMLGDFVSDRSTDPKPEQGLTARSEVKG